MQIQLLSATLEDRYPPGYTCERSVVIDAPKDVPFDDRATVEKNKDGCVAFLFGRTDKGESVALRQEGVYPRMFYRMQDTETTHTIKMELEKIVEHELQGTLGLKVSERQFAHAYGYEPDDSSPSGRRLHRYAEVNFPNLASLRRMKKIQRGIDRRKLQRLINEHTERLALISCHLTDASRKAMQGRLTEEERDNDGETYKSMEKEQTHISQDALPALRDKLKLLEDGMVYESEHSSSNPLDDEQFRYPHEHFVEPLTRFFQEENLSPGRWYEFATNQPCEIPVTLCDAEFYVSSGGLTPVERNDIAPCVTCYYDIETTGLDPVVHPIIQISVVFEVGEGGGELQKHIIALGAVDETLLPGIKCHVCNYEYEVLETFAHLVRKGDPDFMVTYNGVNFDNNALSIRAQSFSPQADGFFFLSRFALKKAHLRELSLSSNGMGDNLFRFFDLAGRQNFDWFVKLKRDLTSEASYSLNHFARTVCGDTKKEMNYKEIPMLQRGTDADRARLAEYCVHDSVLLASLNALRCMVIEILQFASVFGIIPEWVYFRGQQVRFISQLLRKVRVVEERPLLLNVPHEGFVGSHDFGKFQGATVNNPIVGFYKIPVVVVDWQSLYPSVMMGHNLCPSTHISREQIEAFVQAGWELVAPSAVPKTSRAVVVHDIGDERQTYFVHESVKRGILPIILEEQAAERKALKRMQKEFAKNAKEAGDAAVAKKLSIQASVYDKKQLAMKTSMNSVYGACGASSGKYSNRDISSTVTAEGRYAMVVKKRILPERYPGVSIVYGDTDSIMMTFDDVITLGQANTRGIEVEKYITEYFQDVLHLKTMVCEYEKILFPYLQQGKKRYAGRKYEPGPGGEMVDKGIDCKGLETERKDTLPFTKEIMAGILDKIMNDMDEGAALCSFQTHMQRLVDDQVPFEHYIMKKNLSAKVQGKTESIVQAKVNRDRREREPGSEAATGEQVEYVIVNGHKKDKTTQLAQDPKYALEMGMKPNRLWYFEHAIEEPVKKIFNAFPEVDIQTVCDGYRCILDSKRLNVGDSLKNVIARAGDPPASVDDAFGAPSYVPRDPVRKKTRKR